MENNKTIAVGIDLGTGFSSVAVVDEYGKPKILQNSEFELNTRSVVLIYDDGKVIVGTQAFNESLLYPNQCFQWIKREMGKDIVLYIDKNGVEYKPQRLVSYILAKLKLDAEKSLGQEIKYCVITVPAYFKDPERQATIEGGRLAGFEVLGLLNEPTASALAYGMDKEVGKKFIIYDFGAGTFDVSIAKVEKVGEISIIDTDGVRNLGGHDIDNLLIQKVNDFCEKEYGFKPDPVADASTCQEIREKAERLKISLSCKKKSTFVCNIRGKQVSFELPREEFENMIKDLIKKTIDVTQSTLEHAKLSWKDIDDIVLTGGSSCIPLVKKLLKEVSGKDPKTTIEPDKAVALGAAIYAALLAKEAGLKVVDPLGRELYLPNIVLKDIMRHPLGIIVQDPTTKELRCCVMIERGTTLPAKKVDKFKLVEVNQTGAKIKVVQGEKNALESECLLIGELELRNLPIASNDKERIEVVYEYDKDGIIHVTATDLISMQKVSTDLNYAKGLSNEEINNQSKEIQKQIQEE